MAFMMGCEKVHHEYPAKLIFEELTLGVEDGDRIGIVGRNGDGKSTLLHLLNRDIEPDGGRVTRVNNLAVGYLGQKDSLNPDDTVERAVVGDLPEYEWASSARTRAIIDGLISDVDWLATVGSLSGGQRRRVDLVRLLIGDWDVLMLDEPTNHLDMKAITWLANHLKSRWPKGNGALLVVTHDRWFLDEVCLNMWEVYGGRVVPFEGGFSAYIQQRVERDRIAQVTEARRKNIMRKELAWLSRGARARATKPKFHLEAARALVAQDPPPRDTIELKRMAMQRLGKKVLNLHNVSVRFGETEVLSHIDWMIGPGDRIGILGLNGVGKTTLLNVLQGKLKPTEGTLKVGQTVRVAMLSQRMIELEPIEDDPVRVVLGRFHTRYEVEGKQITPAKLLERLGFNKKQLNDRVMDLSGGQRRRLQLLMVLMKEPNVLILDEPGNDMDTDMLAVMEDLLDSWPGTLLMVTHDRYLMERVTDDQYALIDGTIRHVPGGVDEYLEIVQEMDEAAAAQAEKAAKQPSASTSAPSSELTFASASETAPRLTGAQLHQARKRLLSLERKLATAEKRLSEAQDAMESVDPSDYIALTEQQQAIADLREKRDALEDEWLELSEELGE